MELVLVLTESRRHRSQQSTSTPFELQSVTQHLNVSLISALLPIADLANQPIGAKGKGFASASPFGNPDLSSSWPGEPFALCLFFSSPINPPIRPSSLLPVWPDSLAWFLPCQVSPQAQSSNQFPSGNLGTSAQHLPPAQPRPPPHTTESPPTNSWIIARLARFRQGSLYGECSPMDQFDRLRCRGVFQ